MEEAHCGEDPELRRIRLRFGEEVRAARIKAGLTQAQLAKRLGRSQKYVSSHRDGQSAPADRCNDDNHAGAWPRG